MENITLAKYASHNCFITLHSHSRDTIKMVKNLAQWPYWSITKRVDVGYFWTSPYTDKIKNVLPYLQPACVSLASASTCKINTIATLPQNNVTLILFGAKFEAECVYLFPEITSSFFRQRCVTLPPAVPWHWMSHYPSHAATFCCLHNTGHRTQQEGQYTIDVFSLSLPPPSTFQLCAAHYRRLSPAAEPL